jgi:hypothetical protein
LKFSRWNISTDVSAYQFRWKGLIDRQGFRVVQFCLNVATAAIFFCKTLCIASKITRWTLLIEWGFDRPEICWVWWLHTHFFFTFTKVREAVGLTEILQACSLIFNYWSLLEVQYARLH